MAAKKTGVSDMAYNTKFRAGEGVYVCECCGRKTRDTIGSDGRFCGQCEELLMLQNSHWDGMYNVNNDPPMDALRDEWIATIAKRGGNVEDVKRQCRDIFPPCAD
jgi:hypothetical protein